MAFLTEYIPRATKQRASSLYLHFVVPFHTVLHISFLYFTFLPIYGCLRHTDVKQRINERTKIEKRPPRHNVASKRYRARRADKTIWKLTSSSSSAYVNWIHVCERKTTCHSADENNFFFTILLQCSEARYLSLELSVLSCVITEVAIRLWFHSFCWLCFSFVCIILLFCHFFYFLKQHSEKVTMPNKQIAMISKRKCNDGNEMRWWCFCAIQSHRK